jgi:hypothetical protein
VTSSYMGFPEEVSYEQADTRMMCHLALCVNGVKYRQIVIHDTDIMIMCMCYYVLLDNVKEDWIEKNDTINACESKVLVNILLETYILSGCGVVSFFYTQSKSKQVNWS